MKHFSRIHKVTEVLCCWYTNSLKASKVEWFTNITLHESTWCEISLGRNDKLLLGLIYRSPSSNEENNRHLRELIDVSAKLKYSHYLLMGDFNYKDINWET